MADKGLAKTNSKGNLLKEEVSFIAILSDYINEKKTIVPDDVDIKCLENIANNASLGSIVYYQTRLPDLKVPFAAAPYYAENRRMHLDLIDKEFGKEGIDHLVFKGIEIAKHYRHPHLRTSGDIDLLVRQEDKEKAGRLLEKMGFSSEKYSSEEHEWIYTKGDYEIELHHRLLYDDEHNDDEQLVFSDSVWNHASRLAADADGNPLEESTRYVLEDEYHFMYLLLHLRKHFLWAGAGMRQFLDLAVMLKNARLDYKMIETYVDACNIRKFASIVSCLLKKWFDVEVPFACEMPEAFFIKATKKILSDGVFGDMSAEALKKNSAVNVSKKKGRISSTIAIIFPSYKAMKRKYPTRLKPGVIGRLQLPAFWIRRMAASIKNKTSKNRIKYATSHLSSDSERIDELGDWGL